MQYFKIDSWTVSLVRTFIALGMLVMQRHGACGRGVMVDRHAEGANPDAGRDWYRNSD